MTETTSSVSKPDVRPVEILDFGHCNLFVI